MFCQVERASCCWSYHNGVVSDVVIVKGEVHLSFELHSWFDKLLPSSLLVSLICMNNEKRHSITYLHDLDYLLRIIHMHCYNHHPVETLFQVIGSRTRVNKGTLCYRSCCYWLKLSRCSKCKRDIGHAVDNAAAWSLRVNWECCIVGYVANSSFVAKDNGQGIGPGRCLLLGVKSRK